jgi:hypothetical protein
METYSPDDTEQYDAMITAREELHEKRRGLMSDWLTENKEDESTADTSILRRAWLAARDQAPVELHLHGALPSDNAKWDLERVEMNALNPQSDFGSADDWRQRSIREIAIRHAKTSIGSNHDINRSFHAHHHIPTLVKAVGMRSRIEAIGELQLTPTKTPPFLSLLPSIHLPAPEFQSVIPILL